MLIDRTLKQRYAVSISVRKTINTVIWPHALHTIVHHKSGIIEKSRLHFVVRPSHQRSSKHKGMLRRYKCIRWGLKEACRWSNYKGSHRHLMLWRASSKQWNSSAVSLDSQHLQSLLVSTENHAEWKQEENRMPIFAGSSPLENLHSRNSATKVRMIANRKLKTNHKTVQRRPKTTKRQRQRCRADSRPIQAIFHCFSYQNRKGNYYNDDLLNVACSKGNALQFVA